MPSGRRDSEPTPTPRAIGSVPISAAIVVIDRKSTRLNSSHLVISYAVFCLKKKRLIEQLERHDPRSGVSDANIRCLITFVEEVNHALHAALHFQRVFGEIASDDFARNLELE